MIALETVPALSHTQVLSPTQVRCFMDCHARWWFKYKLKQPDPPNGNLALGRAVHWALTQNFAQKIETYEDLPLSGVLALFREAWALECDQAEFRDDEDPSQLAFAGEALVGKYLDEVAPAIEPAAVELHVEGEIGGVRVQGFIDVLDVDGRIIDLKTAKASPSGIEPMHRFQVATYKQLAPAASGKGRLDTLVKTKTPKIVLQDFDVTEEDVRATYKIYSRASQAMRSEIYMPNRMSMFCSRRNCAHWRICEREWGGEVPET
jgi:RecB family exonuclease